MFAGSQRYFLMGTQGPPHGLLLQGPEFDDGLPQEIVGAVPHVVPHGYLQGSESEVGSPKARVDEGLVPHRIRCTFKGV